MKILIVDDHPEPAQFVCRTLNEAGNDSEYVSSKSECFEALSADHHDLLLADCDLPDCSVLTLMEELKRAEISIPIVVFTTPGLEMAAAEAMEHGAYGYIIRNIDRYYLILLPGIVEGAYQRYLISEENVKYKNEFIQINQQLNEIAAHDGLTRLYTQRRQVHIGNHCG